MLLRQCMLRDELFTHIDPDDGTIRHFNASAAQRNAATYLDNGKAVQLNGLIDADFVRFVRQSRGIEEYRIARLVEPYISKPLLGVWMPDGTCLMIDGHHRLVKRYALGYLDYDIIIFSEWSEFLIEDEDGHILSVAEDIVRASLGKIPHTG